MILAQEVSESMFHKFSELAPKLQQKLRAKKCENCENELGENETINYLLTKKKVVWWHNWNCFSENKRFTINK